MSQVESSDQVVWRERKRGRAGGAEAGEGAEQSETLAANREKTASAGQTTQYEDTDTLVKLREAV